MSGIGKRGYVQCRLRRPLVNGAGYSEMVAYLPTLGTNGRSVASGRAVVIAEDADLRPWSIVSASDRVVDAAYLRRKHRESRRLSEVVAETRYGHVAEG